MSKVIYDGLTIRATLSSGTGHNTLTRNPTTGEITEVSGTPITATLTDAHILVGNASNVATDVAVSGDVTITNTGNVQIAAGVIVNADINATAAVALTKLAAATANRAAAFGATGFLEPATTTLNELNYSTGLNGNIQAQLDTKQNIITGAASTATSANFATSVVVVTNGAGKLTTATPTVTEINRVAGVTSPIQTQLDTKLTVSLAAPAAGDIIYYNGSVWTNIGGGSEGNVLTYQSDVPTWDTVVGNGIPAGGTTGQYLNKIDGTDYNAQWSTLTLDKVTDVTALAADVNLLFGQDAAGLTGGEISNLIGTTAPIQAQIDNKLDKALGYNNLFLGNAGGEAAAFAPGTNGDVLTMVGTSPSWQPPTPPGDVSGPGSSTDRAIATWNGITGDALYDNSVIIDASSNITGVASLRTVNQGGLILRELTANGTNAVTVRAHGTMASDYTITLPAAAPGSNTTLFYDGADYIWSAAGGGGVVDFTDLGDVPSSYIGAALQGVRVNAAETDLEFYTIGAGTVTSVSGTANRITSTGGTTPVIDISAAYVGQASITTLGTITTGTWNATDIPLSAGGTGATLADPGADRILFWDDSGSAVTWLETSNVVAISGTTLGLTAGTVGQTLITNTSGVPTWSNVIPEDVTGTTYNFVNDDNGKFKRFTNAAGCTATIPTGLDAGWSCTVYSATGAGTITINSSGTLEAVANTLLTENTAAAIYHRGSNIHVLVGTLGSGAGTGTVTSVGLTGVSGVLSVAGSPIVTSGTFALSLDNQTANYGFWGPTSGSSAAPTFRAQVLADLPNNTIEDVTGTTYSFVEADNHKIKRFTNAAGCTATIPTGLTTGWETLAYRGAGAGTVTLASAGTYEGAATTLSTAETGATIFHRGSDIHVALGAFGGGGGGGTVTSVSGTADRITISGTAADPIVDIASTYVGQATITTLGTIATGTWNATTIGISKGGTNLTALGSSNQILAVNNAGTALEYKTVSVSSSAVSNDVGVTLSGANALVINIPSASSTDRGVITTGTQTLAGNKTLNGNLTLNITNSDNAFTVTQSAASSGVPRGLLYTAGAHTGSTASTEHTDITIDLSSQLTKATGNYALNRSVLLNGRTIVFSGASTITNAVTLYATAPTAGANATFTNKHVFYGSGGRVTAQQTSLGSSQGFFNTTGGGLDAGVYWDTSNVWRLTANSDVALQNTGISTLAITSQRQITYTANTTNGTGHIFSTGTISSANRTFIQHGATWTNPSSGTHIFENKISNFTETGTATSNFISTDYTGTLNFGASVTGNLYMLRINPTITAFNSVVPYGVLVNDARFRNGFGVSTPTATLQTRGTNNGIAFLADDDAGNRILELGESGGARYAKLDLGSDATGDIYRRNSSGNLQRLALGTASQVLAVNSGATDIEWVAAGGGGGITNSAAADELMVSDGTNATGNKLYSTSEGNLRFGDSGLSGASRVISVAGSASNIGLYLGAKDEPVLVQDEFCVYDTSNGFLLGDEVGKSIYITALTANHTIGGGDGDAANLKDFDIKAADGINSTAAGRSLNLYGGNAFGTGNLNGGNITLTSGAKNGSGTDGNITIDTLTGYLIIATIPTSSAGLPSGAVWANSNVLTIVP